MRGRWRAGVVRARTNAVEASQLPYVLLLLALLVVVYTALAQATRYSNAYHLWVRVRVKAVNQLYLCPTAQRRVLSVVAAVGIGGVGGYPTQGTSTPAAEVAEVVEAVLGVLVADAGNLG